MSPQYLVEAGVRTLREQPKITLSEKGRLPIHDPHPALLSSVPHTVHHREALVNRQEARSVREDRLE